MIDHPDTFEEAVQVRALVGGHVGAPDQHQDLQALVADLRANDLLEVARNVPHQVKRHTEQFLGRLVDIQFRMQCHPGDS
ncbi:hypothetical protein FQZ97_999540 [compost metagenome]